LFRAVCICAVLFAGCVESGDAETVGVLSGAVAVTWTNTVGVSAAGNDLTKTAGTSSWSAGAASVESIAGDGYVEFTTAENTTAKMAGLSVGDAGQHYSDIDFAIHLKATGRVGVYEGGTLRGGNFTSYVAGDVFRIEVSAGTVTYSKNGDAFYVSGRSPVGPLLVDTSLNSPGATIDDVVLVSTSLSWQNVVGVSLSGDDLTKTGTEARWNAGAASVETIAGDGYVEFSTDESSTAKMAGLGVGDSGQNYADIDYAVWLKANGVFGVYEGGVLRGSNFGTYVGGDVFRVAVQGGTVTYSRNGGAPFYTSSVAPSGPLGVDTSLLTPGGTLTNIRLVAVDQPPTCNSGGPVCGGSFWITNQDQLDVVAGCAEITGDLTIQTDMTAVEVPGLKQVDGTIIVQGSWSLDRLAFPCLASAGNLILQADPASIDLPVLAEVTGLLGGGVTSAGNCYFDSPSATVLDLPALQKAGAIDLCWPTLEEVHMPLLQNVTGPSVGPGGLFIKASPTAAAVEFPALTKVRGGVELHMPASLPVLTQILAGKLRMYDAVSAPQLTEIKGHLMLGPAVTAVSFPSLAAIAGLDGSRAGGLATLDLPALATVIATGMGSFAGDIYINGSVSSLSFPSLRSTSGNFTIIRNGLLTSLAAPLLTSIGPELDIRDNQALPTCYATSIRDQLLANGWSGVVWISGNDDSGTCP
jgi:hypothetical protein